ncbi:MAG: hypothetical protein KF841_10710 [Phycisphaerae bacterium]|nr:hypothetical protein [Phycisphaerae bacterium]
MAFADSLDWMDKPVFRSKSTYEMPQGQPCWLIEEAWMDGSAIMKVVPMTSGWPEDKLPTSGLITVNDKTFKMAQRREDDKIILFGTVPVGTFDLTVPTVYSLRAYDANGVMLVDGGAGWGVEP